MGTRLLVLRQCFQHIKCFRHKCAKQPQWCFQAACDTHRNNLHEYNRKNPLKILPDVYVSCPVDFHTIQSGCLLLHLFGTATCNSLTAPFCPVPSTLAGRFHLLEALGARTICVSLPRISALTSPPKPWWANWTWFTLVEECHSASTPALVVTRAIPSLIFVPQYVR